MGDKFSNDMRLLPGCEYPPADEQIYVDRMINDLQHQLKKLYPDGKTLRQAHPKMHGCVKAEFTVLDDLEKDLKVGIFKEPKTYEAYIRFSNANSEIKHDIAKDVRGMAIKLMDVPGPKLSDRPGSEGCQDFILINNEVFLSRNVKEFHKVIHALAMGKLRLAMFLLNPAHFPMLKRLIKSQKMCHHVLDTAYWSTTPYLFGDNMAVKYHAEPANDSTLSGGIAKHDENFLKTNMKATLSEQDVYFDFYVQLQTDPDLMPVEDPTVKWDSPFIKVAKIKIPRQNFDTDERNHMGNDFSFSPWHSLPEHRPIGGLNRARRAVYYALSDFWHSRNDVFNPSKN